MTIQLAAGTEPELSINKTGFLNNVENNAYWGVPIQYFDVHGDTVTLDSEVATKLDWTIDADFGHGFNIAAVAQRITIDENTLDINPGFFCSYIDADDIKTDE